ncbi:MAG: Isoleucine-tRNA ligase [Parcubacteria group bacterium GW2011_GWA2_42_14]|nr:MAG: Isoleucine-tRNA ligase [Parcubacteria group bacterium GW2011_GWA2_42_14]
MIGNMSDDNKQLSLPEREEKILEFWEKNKIFEKSLAKNKRGKTFIFYEGPPTANAAPGIHHLESRSFKDIIPRYKTMRGFFVPRKAGWDTHGLPVEIQVEKMLGIKTKKDIEKYGIAAFNEKCRQSVWQFKEEWEKSTKRIGFWLDLENPYITYETKYIESLWWIIKEIWKKKLLYQDFKVVPWCPRCETGLSTHELGQPGAYRTVKENSVFVKLKIKGERNEYLLIWTTTPWTLPANVAVAVNPKIEYTKWEVGDGAAGGGRYCVWSATIPPHSPEEKIEVVEKVSGKSLLGTEYEPLFSVPQEYFLGSPPGFSVIPGDFVSTEEGTGMVHIAPAFGDDDMRAVKSYYRHPERSEGSQGGDSSPVAQNDVQLNYPILHTVNVDGTVKKGIVGEGKFVKTADRDIIEYLKKRNLLFFVKPHEHDYPHCWRCDTPLLYFAKNAWWIKMTVLKEKLLSGNFKINWMPEHIKDGRFGEFLREVRDWAFSRERFWGTPLPVWRCGKCENIEAVGSLEELHERSGVARNKYMVMRHGESLSNIKNLCGSIDGHPLTLKGRVQAEKRAGLLKKRGIDLIISSPVLRTRETAEIVGKIIELPVHFDKRIQEVNVGDFHERPDHMYHSYFSSHLEKFTKRPPNGETLSELRARIMDFMADMEQKHSGKTILIVSHEYPIWMMFSGALGWSNEETIREHMGKREDDFIFFAETLDLPLKNLPRDFTGAVNLHRPYIDAVVFSCKKCGGEMKRVPEIIDVWFDSGAMPFAQGHWPFAKQPTTNNQQPTTLLYPADYISEAVDQTRGWFYTLLAVATLLGKGAPYKNVISLGHVLDKNGQKMSKSKGNVINPKDMINKYGADTIRWYFYTINSPGEPKKFDEKDLQVKLRGFLGTLWNSFVFFDTYIDKIPNPKSQIPNKFKIQNSKKRNFLDQWIILKLENLAVEVTKKLDKYDITGAARAIEEFTLNDFSNWYLRRSRRRFQKPKTIVEKNEAALTTAYILVQLSKLTAPFIPFLSDAIWRELRKKIRLEEESVHLAEWPSSGVILSGAAAGRRISKDLSLRLRMTEGDKKLFKDMETVRKVVAEALKLRAEVGIKVRQPLANLQLTTNNRQLRKDLLELIKEEVNVKEITFGKELKLDTVITPELKEEGMMREIVRNIQEMRKDLGLHPRDKIRVQFSSGIISNPFGVIPSEARNLKVAPDLDIVLEKWKKFIMAEAGAKEFYIGGKKIFKAECDLEIEGKQVWAGIDKLSFREYQNNKTKVENGW